METKEEMVEVDIHHTQVVMGILEEMVTLKMEVVEVVEPQKREKVVQTEGDLVEMGDTFLILVTIMEVEGVEVPGHGITHPMVVLEVVGMVEVVMIAHHNHNQLQVVQILEVVVEELLTLVTQEMVVEVLVL